MENENLLVIQQEKNQLENKLKIDWNNLTVENYEEIVEIAEKIRKKYSKIIINSEEDKKGLQGSNSALSNLRSLARTIDDFRKKYNKTIKEKSKTPVEQLKNLKSIIDDTVKDLSSNIHDFDDEQEKKREERLQKLFNNVLQGFEENQALNKDFSDLYKYENFFKGKFLKKTNHLNKMKDDSVEKFISKYISQITNTIEVLEQTADTFAQNGTPLNKEMLNKEICSLVKENLVTNEIPDTNVINGNLVTWLSEQRKMYEQNIIAQQQQQKLAEQLAEKQQEQAQENVQPNNSNDAPTGANPFDNNQQEQIVIQEEQPKEQEESEYYFLCSLSEDKLAKLKEFLAMNNIEYRMKKAK